MESERPMDKGRAANSEFLYGYIGTDLDDNSDPEHIGTSFIEIHNSDFIRYFVPDVIEFHSGDFGNEHGFIMDAGRRVVSTRVRDAES